MLQAKIASTRSTCNSRPVGAVIAKNNRVIATGYNGAMPGSSHCNDHGPEFCYRRDCGVTDAKKDRACVSAHAEINAISQAAKLGISVDNADLYCTVKPCPNCLKALAQAGIKKVYYEFDYDDPAEPRYLSILTCVQLTVRPQVLVEAHLVLEQQTSKRRLEKTE
jgi:dCMP deaminase